MSALLLCLLLCATDLGPTVAPTRLDLATAVASAVEASPQGQRARLVFEQAVADADRERPRLRPDLTLTARADAANQVRDPALPNAIVRRDFAAEVALSARQLLWHWGGSALTRRADAAAAAAEADYRASLATVRLETTEAYLDLWTARDAFTVADEGVKRAAAQVQRVEDLLAVEKVADVDKLQAEAGVLEARAARVEAAGGVKLAQARLNRMLGHDDLDQPLALQSPGELPEEYPRLERAVAFAGEHRPEVVALQLRIIEARAGAEFARADGLPTFSVTGELAARTPSAFQPSGDAGIGLEMNWPITRTNDTPGRQAARAEQAAKLAELSLAELRSGIALEVRSAYRDDDLARQRLSLAQARIAATTEAHRIKALQYERERATLLELNEALLERTRAELDAARAKADVFRAAARFEQAVGQTYDAFAVVEPQGESGHATD